MNPVHVIAVGDFGESVADRLAANLAVAVTRPDVSGETWAADWPLAAVHVLAAWRPIPRLMDQLDGAAFRWRAAWLPIVCEHPYLRVGPVVVPGAGACYTCFRRRLLQQSSMADLEEALDAHYDSQPASGPGGFLPSFSGLAAAMTLDAVHRMLAEPHAEAGRVRQINMLTLQTASGHVSGIHACPRCGEHRDERSRSFAQLRNDLAGLFAHPT